MLYQSVYNKRSKLHTPSQVMSNTLTQQNIVRLAIAGLSLWFLYVVRDVVILLILAVIIAAALRPLIDAAEKLCLPRAISVAAVYLVFFTIVSVLVAVIVPTISTQLQGLAVQLSAMVTALQNSAIGALFGLDRMAHETLFSNLGASLSGSVGDIFSRTASVFSALIATLATLSMAFYMSLQRDGIKRFVVSLAPRQHQKYVTSLVTRIQESFGRWMAGQLVTMVFVGVLYYAILSLLGVPYALVLAVLGGVLEIVPYLGPVMSVIPAALLGFAASPMTGIGVLIGYMVVNLVENHVLIPQIMNKAVGLNPVAVILALLIGAKVAGLIGVIIAVPLAGALSLFIKDVLEGKIG